MFSGQPHNTAYQGMPVKTAIYARLLRHGTNSMAVLWLRLYDHTLSDHGLIQHYGEGSALSYAFWGSRTLDKMNGPGMEQVRTYLPFSRKNPPCHHDYPPGLFELG